MLRCYRFLAYISVLLFLFPISAPANNSDPDFSRWLEQFRIESVDSGISQKTINLAFVDIKGPDPKVIELDRKQPEFVQTLEQYLKARISHKRIRTGREMMAKYPTWLGRVEHKYGVQSSIIVALWGIESSYGEYTGSFSTIRSLATLAFDGRRSSYFRKELLVALRLIDDGAIPIKRMRGSWAGAMGQCQFMPTSFRLYAVDADSSGSINLWASVPDVLGSTAHYLAKAGWKKGQTWGQEVELPEDFDGSQVGLQTKLPLTRWQALGVRRADGLSLPKRDLEASLIMPDGPAGSAYLVFDNFRVIMSWNKSQLFALTVGILSDQLKDQ